MRKPIFVTFCLFKIRCWLILLLLLPFSQVTFAKEITAEVKLEDGQVAGCLVFRGREYFQSSIKKDHSCVETHRTASLYLKVGDEDPFCVTLHQKTREHTDGEPKELNINLQWCYPGNELVSSRYRRKRLNESLPTSLEEMRCVFSFLETQVKKSGYLPLSFLCYQIPENENVMVRSYVTHQEGWPHIGKCSLFSSRLNLYQTMLSEHTIYESQYIPAIERSLFYRVFGEGQFPKSNPKFTWHPILSIRSLASVQCDEITGFQGGHRYVFNGANNESIPIFKVFTEKKEKVAGTKRRRFDSYVNTYNKRVEVFIGHKKLCTIGNVVQDDCSEYPEDFAIVNPEDFEPLLNAMLISPLLLHPLSDFDMAGCAAESHEEGGISKEEAEELYAELDSLKREIQELESENQKLKQRVIELSSVCEAVEGQKATLDKKMKTGAMLLSTEKHKAQRKSLECLRRKSVSVLPERKQENDCSDEPMLVTSTSEEISAVVADNPQVNQEAAHDFLSPDCLPGAQENNVPEYYFVNAAKKPPFIPISANSDTVSRQLCENLPEGFSLHIIKQNHEGFFQALVDAAGNTAISTAHSLRFRIHTLAGLCSDSDEPGFCEEEFRQIFHVEPGELHKKYQSNFIYSLAAKGAEGVPTENYQGGEDLIPFASVVLNANIYLYVYFPERTEKGLFYWHFMLDTWNQAPGIQNLLKKDDYVSRLSFSANKTLHIVYVSSNKPGQSHYHWLEASSSPQVFVDPPVFDINDEHQFPLPGTTNDLPPEQKRHRSNGASPSHRLPLKRPFASQLSRPGVNKHRSFPRERRAWRKKATLNDFLQSSDRETFTQAQE
ncbi:hypothetical protein ACWJJH_07060 [Endozoicomonadaceae bacterium StTr2]